VTRPVLFLWRTLFHDISRGGRARSENIDGAV
jgi:hypothetical protein